MKKLIFLIISVILLTGCSTAIAKNNDVVETTKKQEVQNTTTEVKQETTVKSVEKSEGVKQDTKVYTQEDYENFFNDEYFAGLKIDGDKIIISQYDEKEIEYEEGNTVWSEYVIDKTLPLVNKWYYKNQVDEFLRAKEAGENTPKGCSVGLSSDKTKKLLCSYLLNNQRVNIPEGNRPEVPEGYFASYVAYMFINGKPITNLSNDKTVSEQQSIIDAQRKAEHEAYMNSQKELADAMWAEHEERDAESRAEAQENAANTAAFKQITLNAYAQISDILSQYASSSTNIAGKNIGEMMEASGQDKMTRNDKSIRTITVNGKGSYKIPIDLLPQAREECILVIDAAISELENYTSGVKDSLANGAQSVINDLNKFKAKLY